MQSQKRSRIPFRKCEITLTNVTEGEIICYSLPIIKGYVTSRAKNFEIDDHQGTITLKKLNDNENEEKTVWPVVDGNFKCLANLSIGKNEFVLEYEDCQFKLNLEFRSKKTGYHVLPVYIICDGDDGKFQAPENEDNSPGSACKRISLGSKLIQSFTAEKLFESNLGRKTFQLAGDTNINLECIIFRSRLTSDEIYEMEPEDIWEHFGRELMSSSYGNEKRKFLAFLSCTKYVPSEKEPQTHEEVVSQMRGHIALGGGGLAIFGTGCLHTWPESIDQILPRFLDKTKVDKTRFMDDSCYRGTYGSCFSTTLGSVCHELGHAFDLGHSKRGVMGRGFDNINLVFTIGNQSRDANKNPTTQTEAQHATVSFTRNLNITYSISSPIRRPRGRVQGIRHNSPRRSISTGSEKRNQKTWKADTPNDNEKRRTILPSKVCIDDLTFWDKSCAVLLKYHRWFADNEISDSISSIEFDPTRKTITSPLGIRVVELRGKGGLVLDSWEFLNTYLPKQFSLPLQNVNLKQVKVVVAEDSAGNIIKEPLATG